MSGHVQAGAVGVVGANVQLYAAGTTGNASAPSALLPSAAVSDAAGGFTLSYTCPAGDPLVYLVARGGTVAGNANAGLALITMTGPCSALAGGPAVLINEVTTVAGVYAFHAFLGPGGKLGSAATNQAGLLLAESTLSTLVDLSAGTAPGSGLPGNSSDPSPLLNSLANLLHACLASSGPGSSACGDLYTNTTVSGTKPDNTLDAMFNLVTQPANNAGALYALSTASTAYGNVLRAPPSDWVLYLTLSGAGLDGPTGVSLDSTGKVWVANLRSKVSQFSNTGEPLTPNGVSGYGLGFSLGLAVDAHDLAWVANWQHGGSVTLLGLSGGAVTTGATFTSGLSYPAGTAIDTDGTVWVSNYGNGSAAHLAANGTPISGPGAYSSDDLRFPVGVAIDSHHNAWFADSSEDSITRVSQDGQMITPFRCCSGPLSLAVDQSDNLWVANYYGNSIGLVSSSGQVLANSSEGGVQFPNSLAVDGGGNVWVANYRGPSVTELAGSATSSPGAALSPAAGWAPDAGLLEAYGIAVDSSGSVWVSAFGTNTLVKYIGMAVPVRTPLIGPVRTP